MTEPWDDLAPLRDTRAPERQPALVVVVCPCGRALGNIRHSPGGLRLVVDAVDAHRRRFEAMGPIPSQLELDCRDCGPVTLSAADVEEAVRKGPRRRSRVVCT